MLHPRVCWGSLKVYALKVWSPRAQQFEGSLKHKGVPGHKVKTLDFKDYVAGPGSCHPSAVWA